MYTHPKLKLYTFILRFTMYETETKLCLQTQEVEFNRVRDVKLISRVVSL